MTNNDVPPNYIDEKYEFSAPRFFDFSAGETLEEAAEAERWFQISASYLPSPHVKTRSLLEAKKLSGLEDSYDEVQKLIARVSPKHGKTNISGSSDTIDRDGASGDAKFSSESRETAGTVIDGPLDSSQISNVLETTGNDVPEDTKIYLESKETIGTTLVGASDPPRISKISDTDLLSVISEPKISNLTAISLVSSGKQKEILSSALVNCSSPRKIETRASLSRSEQEVDNLVKNGDRSLLPTSSSVARNLVDARISNDQIGQETTVDISSSSEAKQNDIVEDPCIPKCDNAREDSAKSGSSFHLHITPGKLLAKQNHLDVVKHESRMRKHAHTKKLKRPLPRSQRTKSELPVSSKIQAENHYANKRQKLEGGLPRQVCNSRNIPPAKAVPTLTIPQEFHFHTEERFQTHRGAYCQAFAQGGSPVSPYVPFAEKVLKFQSNATERFFNRPEKQLPLKLTRPKEPDLVTSQRARPTRVKSSAELEEEMIANMPKFKARPLNKRILEAPTLAALPRRTPQLPEFQEFNLKTSERALLHVNAPNNLASGSEIRLVSESRKRSFMINSRFSAPYGPYYSTTLSNERSIEMIEENGPWKQSKVSGYSFDKKLMPYVRQEEVSHLVQGKLHLPATSDHNVHSMVAQNNTYQLPKRAAEDLLESMWPQRNVQCVTLKENMPHPFQFMSGSATEVKSLKKQIFKAEAHSVLLRENSVVSEKTRKPLSEIQISHAGQFGSKVNNIRPTHFTWKENVFSREPSPASVQDHHLPGQLKDPLQSSVIQIKNGVLGRPDSLTLYSGSVPRQIR